MSMILIVCGTVLAAVTILAAAGLHAWRGWLALRRLELERAAPAEISHDAPGDVALRIELAAVRERLKRLEAIASGVEL